MAREGKHKGEGYEVNCYSSKIEPREGFVGVILFLSRLAWFVNLTVLVPHSQSPSASVSTTKG